MSYGEGDGGGRCRLIGKGESDDGRLVSGVKEFPTRSERSRVGGSFGNRLKPRRDKAGGDVVDSLKGRR